MFDKLIILQKSHFTWQTACYFCSFCVFLLCFIKLILGNRYGPGVSSCQQTLNNNLGGWILTLHLNYVAGYTGPLLFLFEQTHNYTDLLTIRGFCDEFCIWDTEGILHWDTEGIEPTRDKPRSHTVCDLNHSANRVYTIGTECSHHMSPDLIRSATLTVRPTEYIRLVPNVTITSLPFGQPSIYD